MYMCLYVCLSVCLSVRPSICLSLYAHVSVCLPVCLSVCLSVMYICMYACMHACMHACMYAHLSVSATFNVFLPYWSLLRIQQQQNLQHWTPDRMLVSLCSYHTEQSMHTCSPQVLHNLLGHDSRVFVIHNQRSQANSRKIIRKIIK